MPYEMNYIQSSEGFKEKIFFFSSRTEIIMNHKSSLFYFTSHKKKN